VYELEEQEKIINEENSSEVDDTNPEVVVIDSDGGRPWRPQDADKEVIRDAIRRRVRNASVADNVIFYPAKPKPTINDTDAKIVAVYARVSTKTTEQLSSIENQTKYYKEKIAKNPNWTMQEIYSDEGKSGTSMKKRTEFRRMIRDATSKKMDLILCASVSRFARNVSDCIKQVKLLETANPSHPVGVYFETEDIYTLDPDSKQLLSIHALLADWESANKSRRMILSYDQRICTGQYPVLDLLGYRHTTDGKLIIQEDEALTVRFIYFALYCGYSLKEVADTLTQKQRATLKGRTDWNAQMVKHITTNERRWGDLSARKTIVIDYTEGKSIKNNHIRDAAYVPKHHKGIVSPEIAKAVSFSISSTGFSVGVPDITVIKNGTLKGFVSVCPGWNGIDLDTFIAVSSSVYESEEITKLMRETRIVSGKEISERVQEQSAGYLFPRGIFFVNRNTPTLTFYKNTISFSKQSYCKLGECDHIEMLYHPYLQMIIVRTCDNDNPNKLKWVNDNGKYKGTVSAKAFTKAIYEIMQWSPQNRYRIKGITRERGNSKLLLFYLNEPQIIDDNNNITYPEYWGEDNIGLCYELKRLRDKIANAITEQDILEQGEIVINPMIGNLPSREQALEELSRLLSLM